MKKALSQKIVVSLLSTVGLSTTVSAFDINDYNKSLIQYGVSWSSSEASFMPGLYLGFAPRIETANNIHFRLGRGNQIRLTGVLDEFTVHTYLYNLKARYELIQKSLQQKYLRPTSQNQITLFEKVLQDEGVLKIISDYESGALSDNDFYKKSLELMKKLNPGRIFSMQFNLSETISRWKKMQLNSFLSQSSGKIEDYARKNPQKTIVLLNHMLFGRINLYSLNDQILQQLDKVVQTEATTQSITESLKLFHLITTNRYQHQVDGAAALQCSSDCILKTHEFTAIYPNGSTIDATKDRQGNRIPRIRETGVLQFLDRAYHDVDHIRTESFYGWAPKMDYTQEGNGIHNPAVRTSLSKEAFKHLTQDFNIPKQHNNLWVVSRGNVSHGCTRMASGHILEVRNIFPSFNEEMKKVKYVGNDSSDYDLFDINGSGQLKVMGVKYYLSYGLESEEGDGYREGKFLIPQSLNRTAFLADLYGQGQYNQNGDQILFNNPSVTFFNYASPKDIRAKAFSLQTQGQFELYEQDYEKDKMQLFLMSKEAMSSLSESNNSKSIGARFVRLFGRAMDCGHLKNSPLCKENLYQQEMTDVLSKMKPLK